MNSYENFLFDLNGFIILRNVLTNEEVNSMNTAIDFYKDKIKPREIAELKNAKAGTTMSSTGSRQDLGGMLGWQGESGATFRRLLCHRNVTPYLIELCGEGYRLDHHPIVLLQDNDSEGFSLHGGPISGHDGVPEGKFNPELQYRCQNGSIWNSLLAMSVCLSDSNAGDGGWCCIRGSHKLNFPVPPQFADGETDEFKDHIYQPAVSTGDVILFSEATVHGALPWKAQHQRRLALYRFSPANFAYGRGYLNCFGENVLQQCNEQQLAVLSPPHALRLDRKLVSEDGEDGEVKCIARSKMKRDHDIAIFGSEYF